MISTHKHDLLNEHEVSFGMTQNSLFYSATDLR